MCTGQVSVLKQLGRVVLLCLAVNALLSGSKGLRSQSVSPQRVVAAEPAEIPRFISFTGRLTDASGKPIIASMDVTFALYTEQSGGPQVWSEIQKVTPDVTGKYTVMLGATNPYGVPQASFSAGEARWLGITVNGVEQARVMLVSVPYAMKAGDAETLGGLPASAFVQATQRTSTSGTLAGAPNAQAVSPAVTAAAVGGTGTPSYLPMWLDSANLGTSTAYQSGANIGVGRTVLLGDGASPINVKAFGAKGDGKTNDTAAIAAAIAAIPASGGQLYFPAGRYITSGGFVLPYATDVYGAGAASRYENQYGSEIVSNSPTAALFTVTASVASFRNLAFQGIASAPTASTAIFTNSATDALQRVNIDTVSVDGFYDDIHQGVGSSWYIRGSHIMNPVRYGIYVQNTLNHDDGDWLIDGNYFEGGGLTDITNSAAINIESSGGGKITNNKINATYGNGIRMNVSGSVQTLISNNDIENMTGPPINIVQGWPFITIVGNFINANGNNPCIQANAISGFYIGGNLLESIASTVQPAAIVLTNSWWGTIGNNTTSYQFTTTSSVTGGGHVLDLSTNAYGGLSLQGAESVTYNSTTAANGGLNIENTSGSGSSTINLNSLWQGAIYTGSIASSWYGSGMTFTLPRTFAGKGFSFNNSNGKTLLYIDSATGKTTTANNTLDDGSGNMNIPAGKTYMIGNANAIPLKGRTGAIGGAPLSAGNCYSGSATVNGATTSMVAVASPVTHPGSAFQWNAFVSAPNTVTVNVCAYQPGGGAPATSVYNVRVFE
jgi:Pectate lyase superfamily protein